MNSVKLGCIDTGSIKSRRCDFIWKIITNTLRSQHLPKKRFLQKASLNSKVNNWDVELSDHNVEFKSIKGVKNILPFTTN